MPYSGATVLPFYRKSGSILLDQLRVSFFSVKPLYGTGFTVQYGYGIELGPQGGYTGIQ